MAESRVTSAKLRSGAADLQKLNGQLRSKISELENAESSLNGMWDGDANDKFHLAFSRDKTQMYRFFDAVEQYIRALQQIAENYEAAERKNIAVVS